MVTVTVTDPRIELPDTMNSFASYLVSIMGGNAVRRRYSDFRWLYQRLQTEVPGAIIPIIPHTRTVMSGKKFKIEFMEERRRDLQEFFTAITQHKELCRAPSMTPFMMLEMGEDFDDGKWLIEQNLPSNWEDETLKLEPGNLFPAQPKSPQRGITTFFCQDAVVIWIARARGNSGRGSGYRSARLHCRGLWTHQDFGQGLGRSRQIDPRRGSRARRNL
mmetsp:Transcript_75410/g.153032  ORF Transcript_75410/g.153032 Transcript_75410/m.153032 type:complete len:218 (+) Transcript_75410:74-727(+)